MAFFDAYHTAGQIFAEGKGKKNLSFLVHSARAYLEFSWPKQETFGRNISIPNFAYKD
jgi:hypothetical protein